ncbi:MAG: glycosyltransferase family 4 protein [Cyclobacteriaceae bacterium]|nr:glycosyltransferase family 4 protein [Cyclobacteriaceae bacterium]
MRGQLSFMSQHFETIGVTTYDPKHFSECQKREQIRMHKIEMVRTISFLKDIKALWKLYRFFMTENPDIVHSHTPKAGLLSMVAAWLARVPIRLHTVAGMPLTEAKGLRKRILSFTEKLTYACSNLIYPNSYGLLQIIKENEFCRVNKLKVIANGGSNGVDTEYFRKDYAGNPFAAKQKIRDELGIESSAVVFSFIGRIASEKGIAELVTAFRRLRDKTSVGIKLILIGPFEETYGVLDKSDKEIIISDTDIMALGRFDDVRPYLLASDVYTFPSYREGFPNSVLEAGAMSLPCIVTDINGCNEIIEDEVNGLVVPVKDEGSLYQAMARLMKSAEEREYFSKNSRTVIEQKFRNEVVWQGILNEYEGLLSK